MCNHGSNASNRLWAALLSLTLLLSLTAGLASHEHNVDGDADFACSVDHLQDATAATQEDGGELHAAGSLHEHHCLGCHFNGKRLSTRRLLDTQTFLDTVLREVLLASRPPRTAILRAGGSLRGPPLA